MQKEGVKKKFHFPQVYSLIFVLIIVVAVMTWVVPSGQFDRQVVPTSVGDKTVAVAGTYHSVPKVNEDGDLRQGIASVLKAPVEGMISAAEVVAFVLVVGGAFGILEKSGSIIAGLKFLTRKLGKRDYLLIPIIVTLFSMAGSTNGMGEEAIPFFAIFLPLCFEMGYDSLTAMFIVFLGCRVGCVVGTINPFSVIVSQGIAGITGNPQLPFRMVMWVVYTALMIAFIMIHAKRVKRNPELSITYHSDMIKRKEMGIEGTTAKQEDVFTLGQKLVCIAYLIGLVVMVVGLVKWGWYMNEVCAVFFVVGLFAGIVCKMGEKAMAESFVQGMKDFVFAGCLIGIGKGILVICESGMIMDTILNTMANILSGVPSPVFAFVLYIIMTVIAVFVPSSSGMAALTIPIMAPLAELIGFNPEVAVTALCHGCGMAVMIAPTGSVLMAGLSICGISLPQWWKAIWKFFLMLAVLSVVTLTISAII